MSNMSQEKINPRLIKSNIDLLTKIVKRPTVNEKILSRPPFKFIFDLTTMIIKTTGYLRGLYTEEEFNFENVNKNKETKMAFLDKLIDVIGLINGKTIDVKSAKIVAGVEVEKTNKLLNELAKCVSDKKPFLEAVEKVRKGSKPKTMVKNTMTMTKNNAKKQSISKQNIQKPKQSSVSDGKLQKTEESISENLDIDSNKLVDENKSTEMSVENFENQQEGELSFPDKLIYDDISLDIEKEEIPSTPILRRPSTTTKTDSNRLESAGQIINGTDSILDSTEDLGNKQLSSLDSIESKEVPTDKDSSKYNKKNNDSPGIEQKKLDSASLFKEDSQKKDLNSSYLLENNTTPASKPQQENGDDNEKKSTHTLVDQQNTKDKAVANLESSSTTNNVDSTSIKINRPKTKTSNVNTSAENTTNSTTSSPMIMEIDQHLRSSSVRSARPKSSRPAPPRVMTASRSRLSQLMANRTEKLEENAANVMSGVWIPETVDDESDEFLISSQKLQDTFLTMDSDQSQMKKETENKNDKGHLVQQLLATKNELEGEIRNDELERGEQLAQSFETNQKNNETQLKNQIQSLCQSIGTLTKAMGYLHEDVGQMFEELKKWQNEFESNQKIIGKIQSEMNKELEPLMKELEKIEHQVDDSNEKVRYTRASVFRNEQIISKLIDFV